MLDTYVLKIVGCVDGRPCELDDKYVVRYDPRRKTQGVPYDGGWLDVTADKDKAKQFPDAGQALEYWRQSYGLRPDGKPNRPLTAYHVSVERTVSLEDIHARQH